VLIGDLDSVSPDARARLQAAGAEVCVYPSRKDETDLELALRHAVARAYPAGDVDEILVLGALGGRWDQTLANVLLLAEPAFRTCPVRLCDDRQALFLAPAAFAGAPGDIVSLIPLRGDAHGVTTHGLEYSLADGTLRHGSTLGISNVMTAAEASVTVREGLVLIVHIEGVM
jgi:thiamine pyrophosphokinase